MAEITAWETTPRLMYLAEELRIPVPKSILRLLMGGIIIGSILDIGIRATATEHHLSEDQLMHQYTEGKAADDTSPTEEDFRYLIGKEAMEALEFSDKSYTLTDRLKMGVTIAEFVYEKRSKLIDREEISLADASIDPDNLELPLFKTGFQPFDLLMGGGIPQTLVTLIARPGAGKTSTFLTLMGELRRTHAASSIWFFSLEMPMKAMLYRAKSLKERINFLPDDRFFCGGYTPTEILTLIDENPDSNRVIIYDSPDALGGSGGDQRRFALEEVFRDLIRVKTNCKAVFTASQPRRSDNVLGLDSFAEAWQKAWYSDIVITLTNTGRMPNSEEARMSMSCVKNRFGVADQVVTYGYRYSSLEWSESKSTFHISGWGDSNELREAAGENTSLGNEW